MFQEIFFIDTPIKYFHKDALIGLPNLTKLYVVNTCLTTPPSLHVVRETLMNLEIVYSNISSIKTDYFTCCNRLKAITIAYSKLREVPRMHSNRATLKELKLSSNEIVDMQPLYGIPFLALEHLNLNNNKIKAIEVNQLILPVVRNVVLTGNRLMVLSDLNAVSKPWGYARRDNECVDVRVGYGNPWHCNSTLLWVNDKIFPVNSSTSGACIQIGDLTLMVCRTPNEVSGSTVTHAGWYSVINLRVGIGNEGRRCFVTPSLICCAHPQIYPWYS